MIVNHIRRRAAGLGIALMLGVTLAGASELTPAASAQPPAYNCEEIGALLQQANAELRALTRTLSHLLEGGVTQDEVVYVSNTLDQMSAQQDEVTYLQSLMYQCMRKHPLLNGGGWLERMAMITKQRKRAASLQAKAASLLAKARAARH